MVEGRWDVPLADLEIPHTRWQPELMSCAYNRPNTRGGIPLMVFRVRMVDC